MLATTRPRRKVLSARRAGGFSFVEVMLAVFMAACMAGIVAAAMPMASLSRSKAESADKAAAIAQKEMESIRGVGYANLTPNALLADGFLDSAVADASGYYPFSHVDDAMSDSPSTALQKGSGSVQIEQVDTELRRVTVRIAWSDRDRPRTFALSTLVANL